MTIKAIITGHSRGLGAAIANSLLERGVSVLGLARAPNDALAAAHPARFRQEMLNLADPAALARWLAGDTLDAWLADAGTALLVNNAGGVQPIGPLAAQDAAAVAQAVALNVSAPLVLSAAFAARGPAGLARRILHISSGAGRSAYPGWSVYCATKAALDHHARATVMDEIRGLRICSLAPGVIDTGMQGEIRAADPANFPLRERFEALKRDGALASAETSGSRIAGYLLSEAFGSAATADLRELDGIAG